MKVNAEPPNEKFHRSDMQLVCLITGRNVFKKKKKEIKKKLKKRSAHRWPNL